jgi:queuine/archaeosine tRNA-ribosyltransferase
MAAMRAAIEAGTFAEFARERLERDEQFTVSVP